MVIAAGGIVRRAAWHVALSLVGSFAAFLVGVALLLAQWEAEPRDSRLLLWLGVVIASAVALALSLRPGAHEVTSAVRRIQLLAVVGMLVGVAQFVFTNVYGPVSSGPHLTLESSLEHAGEKVTASGERLVAVKARVTMTNTSERKILVVDSIYQLTGHGVSRRVESGTRQIRLEKAAASITPEFDNLDAVFESKESLPTPIRIGQVLSRGSWFEPRETMSREFVVYVPRDGSDLLRLSAFLFVADWARLNIDPDPVHGPAVASISDGSTVVTRWNIDEPSWVRRLTRKDPVVWSRWTLRRDHLPETLAYIDEKGKEIGLETRELPPRVVDLNEEYGLIGGFSQAELSLVSSG